MTHLKILQFAAAGALTVSTPAAAQHSTDSIAEGRMLGDVVVIGENSHDAVSATTPVKMISHEVFTRLGITDIADALHRLPGVTLRDYGGAGGMKTVSVRGFGAQHTGVSYDGIALSDCQTGEIDLSRYSLDNVEDVSLVVGDNDDIFIPARNAAYAALLSIKSMAPPTDDTAPHLTVQIKAGAFGYVSPFIRYSHNFSNKFAFTASGEYVYAKNDYPFKLRNVSVTTLEKRTNNLMKSGHGETGFIWNINNRNRIDGKIYYFDNNRQLPGQVRYYTNISGETLHDRNAFAQIQYRTWNYHHLSLKLNAKYNWASSEYKDTTYRNGINDASYWQREAYASACLLYAPNTALAFNYSADYIFNNLNSNLKTDTKPYRHTILQSITARYKNTRFTIMARMLLSLYFNSAKVGASAKDMRRLSPSISMSYRIIRQKELYLRLSYKNIFRAPTFNESYFYHYGSTNLLPESTDQFNVGMTWRHNYGQVSYLNLSLDGYVNHVKDKIVAVPYNMFVWTNINVGKVIGRGIETEFTLKHNFNRLHSILATANYGWQRSENRTNKNSPYYGNQIAYIPEHQGSVALGFENPWVNVSIHGYGVSHRYSNNEHYEGTRIAGYTEIGITAYRRFKLSKGEIGIRGDIKNLLDKQYEIVLHYPMPGRSWQVTVNYEF